MLELNGYKAWIEVDSQALTEYKLEQGDGYNVKCWVPSQEGKNFVVHWRDERQDFDTCGYVYIDGQYGDARLISPHSAEGHTSLDTIPIDNYTKGKLAFGKMKLTDDDSVVLDEATAKDLGTIRLKISSGTRGERSYDYDFRGIQQKTIHEKTKKAGGHQIVVGEAMPAAMNRIKFYPNGLPSTTFVFQYRPIDMLRALEIAPPAPRPPPRDSPRPKKEKTERQSSVIVLSSDDEDDEEIQRIRAELARAKARKRKSGEGTSAGSPSAKRPKIEKRIKVEGGVIDLT